MAQPTLPAWKAFVVQFSRDTERTGGACTGRIEHLSSGRRQAFSNAAELLAAFDRLLAEIGEPSR